MAMQLMLDQASSKIAAEIGNIFSPELQSPPRSRQRGAEAKPEVEAEPPKRALSPEDQPPFSKPQLSWMSKAVHASNAASHRALIECVEERFVGLETKVDQNKKESDERMIENDKRMDAMSKELADLKKEVAETTSRTQTASGDHAQRSAAQLQPFQERRAYVIGNLGYDSQPSVIEERARQLLTRAAMPTPVELKVEYRFGSTCRVIFSDPSMIWPHRHKVKDLKFEAPEQTSDAQKRRGVPKPKEAFAWMDVKKSKDERRPNRLVRAAELAISNVMLGKEESARKEVVACTRSKRVYVNTVCVGYTLQGMWRWTDDAASNIGVQDLSALTAEINQSS